MKLSEMKSSPDVGRPERTFPICVAGKLVAERQAAQQSLIEAEEALEAARAAAEDPDPDNPRPKRMGQRKVDPALEKAAADAAAKHDAIRDRMQEHTVTLSLRAVSNGEWRQWVSAHPPRDEDEDPAGHTRDQRWAGGFCNIDDLIADLGPYVTAYGDEEPTGDSWAFIADNAAPGELTMLASTVVGMHEQVVDLGKSLVAWRDARRSVPDSA